MKQHQEIHQRTNCLKCDKCYKFYSRHVWFEEHIAKCSATVSTIETSMSTGPSYSFPSMCICSNNFDCTIEGDVNFTCSGVSTVQYIEVTYVCTGVCILDDIEVDDDVSVTVSDDIEVTDDCADVCIFDDMRWMMVAVSVKYYTGKKRVQREKKKVKGLMSIVSQLNHLALEEKRTVIRESLASSDPNILSNMFTSSIETVHEARFGCGILQYLKTLECCQVEKRNLFGMLLHTVYGDDLYNNELLLTWLAKKLNKRSVYIISIVEKYLLTSNGKGSKMPTTKLSLEVIFDTWNKNSIVTVDRRNGCDMKTINEHDFAKYGDLKMPGEFIFEYFTTKRNRKMVKCIKQVATKKV